MKTKLILTLAAALVLAVAAAPKAHAAVVVGVAVGGPVYVHPWHPYRYLGGPYFVPRPVIAFAPAPVYRRPYIAPAPVFYSRYYGRGFVARRNFYGFRR